MNANSRCKPLLLSLALGAALLATVPAFAQDAGDDTILIAEASVPQDRLVARYSELAGSDAAATALVNDLRTGGEFSVTTDVTTTVTNPDGTTTTTTAGGVLAMRADGLGWGAIAKELGFNLGTLISAGNRNAKATDAATTKADRAAKAKVEKAVRTTGKPDRVTKIERPSRPDALDRPAKPERPERPAKPERGGR